MTRAYLFLTVFFISLCIVCGAYAGTRQANYVKKHPELTFEQKDLILKGKLWVGMTKDEVRASIGTPDNVLKGFLGEREVWAYIYKTQMTMHRKYEFERALKLEFRQNRLAKWYED